MVFQCFQCFPVFSTRRYRSNHTAPQAPSFFRQFQARLPGKEATTSGGDPLDHDIWWGIFGDIFWAVWNNNSFHLFGPFPILSNTWRLSIHLGQSKKSFKPSGGTYLEGARGFEQVLPLDVAKQFWWEKIWRKNTHEEYIYILYIIAYIYISQKFNMFQWFNLMRFGTSRCHQYVLGIAVGGFHGGSGGEQLLVQSYNLRWVWHGESTWNLSICDSCDLLAFSQ